jgi:restriction system protein
MPVPDYQSLMRPVLEACAQGEIRIGDIVDQLANRLGLTPEERSELLPSGRQTLFSNRVHWAKTYLAKAGLIQATKRAHFQITDRGRGALVKYPVRIDNEVLSQYPEFNEFKAKRNSGDEEDHTPAPRLIASAEEKTPDEVMRAAHKEVERSLRQELLQRILGGSSAFFEQLIVSLLVSMGYGGSVAKAGRVLGQSGDNGVDGVIDQDPLGLDRVYIQAKRYALGNAVGAGDIRDFFGSLDRFRAAKGLFVTTSTFTSSAVETASHLSKRIVLIDGDRLAALMIKYDVGVRVEETLFLKKVDEDFFND